MTIQEMLNALMKIARSDEALRTRILATVNQPDSLTQFCAICAEYGYPISVMDIVSAGEEDYDLMRRSINGGGGNHNDLPGDGDPYEMFLSELTM